jgi:hypothetical protein
MTHTVVIALSGPGRGNQIVQRATPEQAQVAVDRFGHAQEVREVADASGIELHVTCATQRGEGGAFRLNNICAGLGLLSHVA